MENRYIYCIVSSSGNHDDITLGEAVRLNALWHQCLTTKTRAHAVALWIHTHKLCIDIKTYTAWHSSLKWRDTCTRMFTHTRTVKWNRNKTCLARGGKHAGLWSTLWTQCRYNVLSVCICRYTYIFVYSVRFRSLWRYFFITFVIIHHYSGTEIKQARYVPSACAFSLNSSPKYLGIYHLGVTATLCRILPFS